MLLDPSLHEGESYESLLSQLPAHSEVDRVAIKFNGDKLGTLEGWPHYYTMNNHIAANGKFNWLMRLGVDISNPKMQFISDEFDMEVSITAPQLAKKGDPWSKVKTCVTGNSVNECVCTDDVQTVCNMPIMWVTVSFHDAIKLSFAKVPQIKNSAFANSGADFSPRLVRKHGGASIPVEFSKQYALAIL